MRKRFKETRVGKFLKEYKTEIILGITSAISIGSLIIIFGKNQRLKGERDGLLNQIRNLEKENAWSKRINRTLSQHLKNSK